MPTLHVQRNIQFRTDLYKKTDRTDWFREMGAELAKRKLSITVAPGLTIKNADEAVAFFNKFQSDKSGLKAQLALPPTATLEGYVGDLVQALDDCVKSTSDVEDKMIDMSASSDFSKALGLDTTQRYAAKATPFGAAAVSSVQGVTLSSKAAAIDPLKGQLYIDKTTFSGSSYQWKRDAVELEQVNGVTGISDGALLEALRSTNAAGRSTFQRLKKPESCEAYTVGYAGMALDDMRWDTDAHKQREKNKFVSLTIESGRFEAATGAATSGREISVGTDKMDDTYYDTPKFDLMDMDFSVRGRARWDTDTEIRRVLVQVKNNTVIDDFGLKRNGKVDVRNDGASAEEIAGLDAGVRTGKVTWNGSSQPLEPMKGVYQALEGAGRLKDIGPHQGVLQLEPKVHIRSVRSRYHLNETDLASMQDFYGKTTAKLADAVKLAQAALPGLSGADKASVEAFLAQATALQDGTGVAGAAAAALQKLDPSLTTVTADTVKALMPSTQVSWNRPQTDQLTLDKKQVVADTLDAQYHAIATSLDGVRRLITGATDRALENHPPYFMAWAKSVDAGLANKTTYDAFVARYDAIAAKPDSSADVKAFNDYGAAQKTAGNKAFKDFTPVDAAGFKALRAQLVNEVVRVNQRQLEAGGSMAKALWFDEARAFYVPSSRRVTSNFIIDTTDMSEYVKHADWEAIPSDKRTPKDQLPADKVFHVSLVNETQIELGEEQPYLKRMDELNGKIAEDRGSLVMKFFDASAQGGIDTAKPETYAAALKAVLDGPAAARDATLGKLNAFLVTQKSALVPLTAKDLTGIPATAFRADNRDKPVRTTGDTERALAGARFVFTQYMDIQKGIVASKGDRILKTLKDAGAPNGLDWKQTDNSKGNTALGMLRGTRP